LKLLVILILKIHSSRFFTSSASSSSHAIMISPPHTFASVMPPKAKLSALYTLSCIQPHSLLFFISFFKSTRGWGCYCELCSQTKTESRQVWSYLACSRQQLAKLSEADKSLQLPDGLVRSSTTVKNPGVVIDERLSFDDQARICIKSCYFHLRRLKQIRRYTLNLMSSIA